MEDVGLVTVPIDEENELFVQDQMPSVEEAKIAKVTAASKCGITSSGRACWVPLFFVVLTVVGLSIGLTQRNADEQQLANNNDSPTNVPVKTPYTLQHPPTLFPTPPLVSRVYDVLHFLETNNISSSRDLSMDGSPQRKAAFFMADQDPLHMPLSIKGGFLQRYAVVVIYFSFHGRRWPRGLGWLTGEGECRWSTNASSSSKLLGNACNDAGELVELSLFELGLNGTLPQETGLLSKLNMLDFHSNNIIGTFPTAIFELTELQYLFLQYNKLSGKIPQTGWAALSKLRALNLEQNNLGGSFPTELMNMTSLTIAQLQFNKLQGELPLTGWEMWSNLTFLSIGNNKLVGHIPQQLITLLSLKTLLLNGNFFEGAISSFSHLPSSLEELNAENNDLTGTLDNSFFQNLTALKYLDLSDNRISSDFPLSILTHAQLKVVDLHNNAFYGELPPEIPKKNSQLQYLAVHNNSLTGPLPETLSNLVGLLHLDLSNNLFESTIPHSIGSMTGLRYLCLAKNAFANGPIPLLFSNLTNIVSFSLQQTNRNGTIPKFFESFRNLSLLDISDNNLTGSVPSSLGALTRLRVLLLNTNQLVGMLPTAMVALTNLDMILLDHNNLTRSYNWLCGNWSIGVGVAPTSFRADCQSSVKESTCSCCSQCCLDSRAMCNNQVWLDDLDPVWGYYETNLQF